MKESRERCRQAMRAMEAVEVVSFDIFDTLLLRAVLKPADVFRLVEQVFGEEAKDFARWRIAAESEARRSAPAAHRFEVTLDEIYEVLYQKYPSLASCGPELKALELKMEKQVARAHPLGQSLYRRARESGRKVVLLSDMYLPAPVVEALLCDCGYEGPFNLFLSNECRQSKSAGDLYDTVARELGCSGSSILHLGDNPHADYKMAIKAGWHAMHVPKLSEALDCENDRPLGESVLEALRLRRNAEEFLCPSGQEKFWRGVGEDVAAPLYLGFVSDLIRKVKNTGAKKLYFCSRDGKIIKEVYELLTQGRTGYPQSQYFFTSRRASMVASFERIGDSELKFLIETGLVLTVRAYLERIHIVPESVWDQVAECGFQSLEELVENPTGDSRLKKLFRLLEPQILAVAAKEREAYLKYMDSVGVFEEDHVIMVDIGWNATIFGAITRLIRHRHPECKTTGYFFGTFDQAARNKEKHSSIHGYFCENCAPRKNYRALKHSVAILEMLFSSEEASLVRLTQDEEPFRLEFDGDAFSESHAPIVRQIQEGALGVLREFSAVCGLEHACLDQSVSAGPIVRMLTQPTREEAIAWGDLVFWPDFGKQTCEQFIARPQSLSRYLWHPCQMKEAFRRSHWRRGFYQRLPLAHRITLRALCPKLKFAYKAS